MSPMDGLFGTAESAEAQLVVSLNSATQIAPMSRVMGVHISDVTV